MSTPTKQSLRTSSMPDVSVSDDSSPRREKSRFYLLKTSNIQSAPTSPSYSPLSSPSKKEDQTKK